jgi:hypothetical protein
MRASRLLGKSLRCFALRWVLAALLLFAQQAALSHALGHAVGHAHGPVAASHEHGHESTAHADHDGSDGRAAVSGQCAFDLVYSQVLGGMFAGYTLHVVAAEPVAHAVIVAQPRGTTASFSYDSRGPPAIS